MKRILTIIILLACAVSMSAQENSEVPAYRNKGYAGNVSISNQLIFIYGFGTSHGYMFNEHHYLGGGVGFYATTLGNHDKPVEEQKSIYMSFQAFAEYKSYWLKKRSTPTAGLKVGYSAYPLVRAFEVEPYIGWDWGLKNGKGISAALGATLFPAEIDSYKDIFSYSTLLKLSVGFNF